MKTGRIKFYNQSKGYGFAIPDDGGKDIFLHCSGLVNRDEELTLDTMVEYEESEGKKGPIAINVSRLS